jgi:hypothetical protein
MYILKARNLSDSVPLILYVRNGLVYEDIPTEHILDLTALDALDVVVELE